MRGVPCGGCEGRGARAVGLTAGLRVRAGDAVPDDGPAFRATVPAGAVLTLERPINGGRLWVCVVEGSRFPAWVSGGVLAELVRDGLTVPRGWEY